METRKEKRNMYFKAFDVACFQRNLVTITIIFMRISPLGV